MKINVILPFTSLTGGIKVVFMYCNFLVEKGYDVICYVPKIPYRFNLSLLNYTKSFIKNCILYDQKSRWFDRKFEIKSVIKINNKNIREADITIATAWPTAVDLARLDDKKGKKVYFIQAYETFSGKKEEVDLTYKLNLNNIVVTKNLHDFLYDNFNTQSEIIYNGLDESEFIKGDKKTNTRKTILMLVDSSINKGSKEGVEILKNLQLKYDINIILFGVKKPSYISNEFDFYELPSREELISLYQKSDIYLFTSKYESWGLPVLEAMSNKCAVVGMDTGVISEFGIDGKNCIMGSNYEELYKGLEQLLVNDDLLCSIQNNGYQLSIKFNWKYSYIKFEKYLRGLYNEK